MLYAMLKKKTSHPPLFFWNNSPTSTPELSPTSSSSDSESDGEMEPSSSSRPLSLTVQPGAYNPMRPTLDEVLANTAPPPYTLSAFMAYLSQNHCLETLEFTLEAKRYRETYNSLAYQLRESPIVTDCPETQHLGMLWQRLLTAYILPAAPREINVSSEVREELVRLANRTVPPPPETLDAAVKLVHDLMEESIFLPFLNAHAASPTALPLSAPLFLSDESVEVVSNLGLDDESVKRVRSKRRRLSPRSSKELGPLITDNAPLSHPNHPNRSNFSLSAVTQLGKAGNRTSAGQISSDPASATSSDDTGSSHSIHSIEELMTPPTTPPSSEPSISLAHSPKHRADNPWKKMGMKFGFKKRSGSGDSGGQSPRLED